MKCKRHMIISAILGMMPACENGIGFFGDEWRIVAIVNPDLPY